MNVSRKAIFSVLGFGVFLSILIMVAIFRYEDRHVASPSLLLRPFSLVLHLMIFVAISAPFFLFFTLVRRGMSRDKAMSFVIPYLACHGYLVQLYYRPSFNPHEFGFAPLIFLPLVESVVAIP